MMAAHDGRHEGSADSGLPARSSGGLSGPPARLCVALALAEVLARVHHAPAARARSGYLNRSFTPPD